MPAHKKPPLQVKTHYPIGISKGVIIAFEQRILALGLQRSATVEALIEQFLNDTKSKK